MIRCLRMPRIVSNAMLLNQVPHWSLTFYGCLGTSTTIKIEIDDWRSN